MNNISICRRLANQCEISYHFANWEASTRSLLRKKILFCLIFHHESRSNRSTKFDFCMSSAFRLTFDFELMDPKMKKKKQNQLLFHWKLTFSIAVASYELKFAHRAPIYGLYSTDCIVFAFTIALTYNVTIYFECYLLHKVKQKEEEERSKK